MHLIIERASRYPRVPLIRKSIFARNDPFSQPKAPSDDSSPWYEAVRVGKNKLGSMVKDMCIDAGIPPRTNHSLRATGATALFQSNLPEQIIQKTTGHRSLDGLRMYECVSTRQQQAVSGS